MLTKVDKDLLEPFTVGDIPGLGSALDTKAAKGANSDITSLTGLTTPLSVAQGGTGQDTLAELKTAMNFVKGDVGLGNVDNTSDAAKPISTATQAALDGKLSSVVAGTNVTIDDTDPQNPIISATAGAADIPGTIVAAPEKSTPIDADSLGLVDSAASNVLKELTWGNVKATLKTYFDTLYQPLATALTEWAAKARPSGVVVGTTDAQTLSSKTIDGATLRDAITVESYAFNTSTNAAVDLANGVQQRATLTGNWTPGSWPAATTAGQFLELILIQDGTGSRTVTWPVSVIWPSSTAPTITATASKGDIIHFRSDGTNWLGNVAGQVYF